MKSLGARTCCIIGCSRRINGRFLFCLFHSRIVPKPIQDETWRLFRTAFRSSEFYETFHRATKAVQAHEEKLQASVVQTLRKLEAKQSLVIHPESFMEPLGQLPSERLAMSGRRSA